MEYFPKGLLSQPHSLNVNGFHELYLYNEAGMRIYKQSGGIGVPSESFYLISAGGVMYSIEETQFHSNGNGNSTIERYNIPDLGYEDQHKEINYQIQDHLGNLRLSYTVLHCPSCSEQNCASVDVQYQVNYIAEYLAYGGLLREFVRNGTAGEKFLSTGHERDKQTSWDYRQARYYDADLGRFLAVDPMAGAAPGWSPYRYAFDNPISINDPTGLFETKGDAREWAKENGIRIGWFSSWKLVDNGESGFAIENRKKVTRYVRDGIDNDQLSLNPDGVTVEALVSGNKSVGEPGTLESMIPIWGSGRNAVNEFQNGNIDLGLMHTALAISDVFLIKAVGTAIGKSVWKAGASVIKPANASGALRVEKWGAGWQSASLEKAIARHTGPNATSWTSKTGKTIFENPLTGRQVVVDNAGYFRIFQPKSFGSLRGSYLDMLGKVPTPATYLKNGSIGSVP